MWCTFCEVEVQVVHKNFGVSHIASKKHKGFLFHPFCDRLPHAFLADNVANGIKMFGVPTLCVMWDSSQHIAGTFRLQRGCHYVLAGCS